MEEDKEMGKKVRQRGTEIKTKGRKSEKEKNR